MLRLMVVVGRRAAWVGGCPAVGQGRHDGNSAAVREGLARVSSCLPDRWVCSVHTVFRRPCRAICAIHPAAHRGCESRANPHSAGGLPLNFVWDYNSCSHTSALAHHVAHRPLCGGATSVRCCSVGVSRKLRRSPFCSPCLAVVECNLWHFFANPTHSIWMSWRPGPTFQSATLLLIR